MLLEPFDHGRAVAHEGPVGALDDRDLDEPGLRRDAIHEFVPRDLVRSMRNALVREVRLHLPAEVRDVVDVERVRLEARWIVHRGSALLHAARLHDHGRWRHPRGRWRRGRPPALAARLEKGCHARWQIWPVPGSGIPGENMKKALLVIAGLFVLVVAAAGAWWVGARDGWLGHERTAGADHGQGHTGRLQSTRAPARSPR